MHGAAISGGWLRCYNLSVGHARAIGEAMPPARVILPKHLDHFAKPLTPRGPGKPWAIPKNLAVTPCLSERLKAFIRVANWGLRRIRQSLCKLLSPVRQSAAMHHVVEPAESEPFAPSSRVGRIPSRERFFRFFDWGVFESQPFFESLARRLARSVSAVGVVFFKRSFDVDSDVR